MEYHERVNQKFVTVDMPELTEEQYEQLRSAIRSGNYDDIPSVGMEELKHKVASTIKEVGKEPIAIKVGYREDDFTRNRISAQLTFPE